MRLNALDKAIREAGASAYAAYGSSANADIRYLTRFRTDDPVMYLKRMGAPAIMVIGQMEVERAARESPTSTMTRAESGLLDILKEEPSKDKAVARVFSMHAPGKVLIPPDFPYSIGRELESLNGIVVDPGTIRNMRAVKSGAEITMIRKVQGVTDKAMETGARMIRKAKAVRGKLILGGKVLTSEKIRAAMHVSLLDAGCYAAGTIVSCGPETAIPHARGTGPLKPDQPIVIDIFPRNEQTGYFSDMTRTFVKGEPDLAVREMYNAVLEAQTLGQTLVSTGKSGPEIHASVARYFTDAGFENQSGGFIHNLGHGVGLEVHELPVVGPGGGDLVPGNVITIEPGLYYPGIGGVRLENTGAVTSGQFESFTTFGMDLIL